MGKLRVLLVVGSLEMHRRLRAILDSDIEIEVAAEANNAYTARDKIIECNPDVMLLCHDLPRMKGITFLERLMPQRYTAAFVIAEEAYEDAAYSAGAKDFAACDKDAVQLENINICQRLKRMAAAGGWLAGKNTNALLPRHIRRFTLQRVPELLRLELRQEERRQWLPLSDT